MIKAIQDVESINKIIRDELIQQTGLSGEFVRSSLSEYGTDLDKEQNYDNVFESIDKTDAIIFFELKTRSNDSDVSMTEENDSITLYKSFRVHLIIYGNSAYTIAAQICGRFRTEYVRRYLQENGVYIEEVSDFESLYEFKAMTMWPRCDIDIDISCRIDINQVTDDYQVDELSDLEIIVSK